MLESRRGDWHRPHTEQRSQPRAGAATHLRHGLARTDWTAGAASCPRQASKQAARCKLTEVTASVKTTPQKTRVLLVSELLNHACCHPYISNNTVRCTDFSDFNIKLQGEDKDCMTLPWNIKIIIKNPWDLNSQSFLLFQLLWDKSCSNCNLTKQKTRDGQCSRHDSEYANTDTSL